MAPDGTRTPPKIEADALLLLAALNKTPQGGRGHILKGNQGSKRAGHEGKRHQLSAGSTWGLCFQLGAPRGQQRAGLSCSFTPRRAPTGAKSQQQGAGKAARRAGGCLEEPQNAPRSLRTLPSSSETQLKGGEGRGGGVGGGCSPPQRLPARSPHKNAARVPRSCQCVTAIAWKAGEEAEKAGKRQKKRLGRAPCPSQTAQRWPPLRAEEHGAPRQLLATISGVLPTPESSGFLPNPKAVVGGKGNSASSALPEQHGEEGNEAALSLKQKPTRGSGLAPDLGFNSSVPPTQAALGRAASPRPRKR